MSEFDTLPEEGNLLVFDSADDVGKIAPEDDESVEKRRMGSNNENWRFVGISLVRLMHTNYFNCLLGLSTFFMFKSHKE